jgi:hypothetical protein
MAAISQTYKCARSVPQRALLSCWKERGCISFEVYCSVTEPTAAELCAESPKSVGNEQQEEAGRQPHNLAQKRSSGQLMDEPVMRAFAVDYSTLRCSRAGRCKIILWAPLATTFPFRACHRNANALKETPTAQLFDNRSIA